jgi:hypothetical protein
VRPGEDSVFVYRVLGSRPNALETELIGETRKTTTGQTVRWDFVRLGADAFCWRRSDWAATGCTRAIVRLDSARGKVR